MTGLTRTTTVFLEGLLDPANIAVWIEFDQRYRPVIIAFARRLGLAEADAEDVAQETLTRFLRSYRSGNYDRARARLSTWIVAIARHCVGDVQRHRAARRGWRGESALADLADDAELESVWEEECRRWIMAQALRELRDGTRCEQRTIRAFELVAFEGRLPIDVAAELRMTVDAVYTAKNRCIGYLRQIVGQLNERYEVV